jgi:hypothetical protein
MKIFLNLPGNKNVFMQMRNQVIILANGLHRDFPVVSCLCFEKDQGLIGAQNRGHASHFVLHPIFE